VEKPLLGSKRKPNNDQSASSADKSKAKPRMYDESYDVCFGFKSVFATVEEWSQCITCQRVCLVAFVVTEFSKIFPDRQLH
jgi:hypothetical protein